MTGAAILLSGGLDSAVSLALARSRFDKMTALIFDYGQKAVLEEIKASKALAEYYGTAHEVIKLGWLGRISASALNTDGIIPVLTEKELENSEKTLKSAAAVWVPNRNALFINIAAAFAEALNYQEIIIGANKEEAGTFIDNSKEFINAQNEALKYSVNFDIKITAPLINMTKTEIVLKGIELNIPFHLIYSCYNKNRTGLHCGKCESCIRLKRALKNCGRHDIIKIVFGE